MREREWGRYREAVIKIKRWKSKRQEEADRKRVGRN